MKDVSNQFEQLNWLEKEMESQKSDVTVVDQKFLRSYLHESSPPIISQKLMLVLTAL